MAMVALASSPAPFGGSRRGGRGGRRALGRRGGRGRDEVGRVALTRGHAQGEDQPEQGDPPSTMDPAVHVPSPMSATPGVYGRDVAGSDPASGRSGVGDADRYGFVLELVELDGHGRDVAVAEVPGSRRSGSGG